MTWTEAKSPHTLDNPTLYFMGCAMPTFIHYLPMSDLAWWAVALVITASVVVAGLLIQNIPGEWLPVKEKKNAAGYTHIPAEENASRQGYDGQDPVDPTSLASVAGR